MPIKQIKIKLLPRSSINKIVETDETGEIKIKIKAPPVDGEANEELIRFLSKEWDIPKSKIKIVKGEKSKHKLIEVETI